MPWWDVAATTALGLTITKRPSRSSSASRFHVGYSVDRRAIGLLVQNYNDATIRSLACFCCGQTHVTFPRGGNIDYQDAGWFVKLGLKTLEENLGWDTWYTRFGKHAPLVE